MKTIFYFITLMTFVFLVSGCTKDCCYDGNPISIDEALDVAGNNEINDTIFTSSIAGDLKSMNGKGIKNLKIMLTDSIGRVFHLSTDDDGKFEKRRFLNGSYRVTFDFPPIYNYSTLEYDIIYQNISHIILGDSMATTADKLAYDVVNFGDITTLDRLHFENFKKGEEDIANFQPWRVITKKDFDNQVINIRNYIDIVIKDNEAIDLDILLIYIGDPKGFTL